MAEAGRYSLPALELEARLVLGRFGRASLPQLASDALQAGYKLIARKASQAGSR
jgi:hypothetical protein